jgi:hypothetical protein
MMKIHTICLSATFVVALLSTSVSAGTIAHPLDFPPGPPPIVSGPGLGIASVPIVSTLSIDNDNQPGGPGLDNNIDVNLKRFDFNDYIDMEFTVLPSNGTTEYRVVEFVDNNTGVPWSGYRLQLGFGTGPGFIPASAFPVALDFDAPLYDFPPASTAMVISTTSPDELVFSGFHGSAAEQYSFRIDVPNLPTGIPGIGGAFTLRQTPIPIPEPSAFALVAAALIGFVRLKR